MLNIYVNLNSFNFKTLKTVFSSLKALKKSILLQYINCIILYDFIDFIFLSISLVLVLS